MSRALLDTSALIDELGELPAEIEELAVSAVTLGELHLGTLRVDLDPSRRATRIERLERVRRTYAELAVDGAVAAVWGRLAASLRDAGRAVRVNDVWVAATALAHGAAVVTRDRDYEAIKRDAAPELSVISFAARRS